MSAFVVGVAESHFASRNNRLTRLAGENPARSTSVLWGFQNPFRGSIPQLEILTFQSFIFNFCALHSVYKNTEASRLSV